jgi:hypothetical protein
VSIGIKTKNFPALLKFSFYLYSFIVCGSLENDPLSPPEGEAAQGEYPLDPLFYRDIFQDCQELSQFGDARAAGAEA